MEIPELTLSFPRRLGSRLRGNDIGWIFHRLAILAFILFVLANAWVSEDAYITLRVLDNFFNGYGLRWNINERVQAYTHPLWLLLHIPISAVLANLFLTNVLLSVFCSTGALLVTLATVRRPLLATLSLLYMPLFASRALRDYSSSGLENPLSYLLFAAFGYVMVKRRNDANFWFWCSLIVSLSLFNRLDTIILYAPALLWLACTRLRDIRWKQVMFGALPLLAWFAFALLYYGFLFPNTKYAKLDTGVPTFRYVSHGISYARYTILTDTITALEIFTSLIFIAFALRRSSPGASLFPASIAMGVVWYVLYVLAIGGDYMLGRFWALPAFAGIWLVYVFMPQKISRKALCAIAALLLIVGAPFPTSQYLRRYCPACNMNPHPMIDAKWMFQGNFFIPKLWPLTFNTDAHHKFVGWAAPLARKAPMHVEKAHFIGMLGYYAGPGNVLIDELALADPLLARLPFVPDEGFFIGHFRRTIPEGYLYAVKTGSTEKMDPSLALYYEKLRLITSGDLFDPERLKTIVAFNLGRYDHWKRDYLNCSIW